MAAVWEQRWSEFVRRVLALRESSALAALPDLMPALVVNDPGAPESALARHERRWTGYATVSSNAANRALIGVHNGRAGTLVIVERMYLWASAAVECGIGLRSNSTAVGTAGTYYATTDLRGTNLALGPTGTPPGATLRQFDNNLGALGLANRHWPPTTPEAPLVITEPFILRQNDAVYFQAVNVGAVTLHGTFYWRERRVDSAELAAGGA